MRVCLLSLVVAMSVLSGCGGGAPDGPRMYPVTGTLTVGDKPLADINVQLIPADVSPKSMISSGKTDASGRFAVVGTNGQKGAVPGKYKVVLARAGSAAPSSPASHGQDGGPPRQDASLPFPKEYSDLATSPRTVDVSNQAITLDLKL